MEKNTTYIPFILYEERISLLFEGVFRIVFFAMPFLWLGLTREQINVQQAPKSAPHVDSGQEGQQVVDVRQQQSGRPAQARCRPAHRRLQRKRRDHQPVTDYLLDKDISAKSIHQVGFYKALIFQGTVLIQAFLQTTFC